jgi:hypothetical protein
MFSLDLWLCFLSLLSYDDPLVVVICVEVCKCECGRRGRKLVKETQEKGSHEDQSRDNGDKQIDR